MSILDEARAAVAGESYAKLDQAKAVIRRQQLQLSGIAKGGQAIEAAVAELAGVAMDTGSIPDDFMQAAAQRVREAEDRDVQHRILVAAARAIDTEREAVRSTSAEAGLAWLDRRLNELMGEIRSIPTDLIFTNAAAAISRGTKAVAAWTQLEEHTKTYEEIRQAETTLLGEARGDVSHLIKEVYWTSTRIPHDISYLVVTGQTRIGHVHGVEQRSYLEPQPYPGAIPISPDGATIWPTTDKHGYLRWLADRGDAWVPASSRQVRDALTARQAAMTIKLPMDQLIDSDQYGDLPHLARIERATV